MNWSRAFAVSPRAVLGVVLVAAGCGGSSSSSTTTQARAGSTAGRTGQTTLRLAASSSGGLEFDKKTLEARVGEVTIVMTNDSSVPHNIAVEGNGIDVVGKVVSGGEKSTVSANLKPGTYTFYCSVDSHEQAGMKGTLTVR